jgi:hypothetical protein
MHQNRIWNGLPAKPTLIGTIVSRIKLFWPCGMTNPMKSWNNPNSMRARRKVSPVLVISVPSTTMISTTSDNSVPGIDRFYFIEDQDDHGIEQIESKRTAGRLLFQSTEISIHEESCRYRCGGDVRSLKKQEQDEVYFLV